jgi:hypothetical protein
MDAIIWFLQGMWSGIAGPIHVLLNLGTYLDFSNPENILRVVYYGASVQLFFLFFNTLVAVFVIGIFYRRFLWGVVVGLEGFANVVGRIAAWAGLLMVLQQVMVIFLQSIFRAARSLSGRSGSTRPIPSAGGPTASSSITRSSSACAAPGPSCRAAMSGSTCSTRGSASAPRRSWTCWARSSS